MFHSLLPTKIKQTHKKEDMLNKTKGKKAYTVNA